MTKKKRHYQQKERHVVARGQRRADPRVRQARRAVIGLAQSQREADARAQVRAHEPAAIDRDEERDHE